MPRGEMKVRNRRGEDEDDGSFWEVLTGMGMPLLYILALVTGIVGAICMGVITEYWSNLDPPKCFLYSGTSSSVTFYKFGGSMISCDWVTYGAVTAVLIAFISGLVYTLKVRYYDEMESFAWFPLLAVTVAMLLMLAVTCTMAEGLRITCTAMGLNIANNKGVSCFDKLEYRVASDYLPVQTSTMVRSSLIGLISSTILLFIITCFHVSHFYRLMRK